MARDIRSKKPVPAKPGKKVISAEKMLILTVLSSKMISTNLWNYRIL